MNSALLLEKGSEVSVVVQQPRRHHSYGIGSCGESHQ